MEYRRQKELARSECPSCHWAGQWIDKKLFKEDGTSLQKCDYCKELVYFTKVETDKEEEIKE